MVNAGTLVLGMNAAFGLLEAGCVRNRNVLNIMMKNISDMTLGGVIWWVCGYTIAFQVGSDEKWPVEVYDHAFWYFQWTFAATASTICSGAIAERVNYLSYIAVSIVTTGIIYPICVSWVWASGGYLSAMGFLDFAGGACVHMLGAMSAFVCCLMVGPRVGRFPDYAPSCAFLCKFVCRRSADADYYVMPPAHPQIKAVVDPVSLVWGVFFLWIGWYGFNPGGVPDIEFGGAYVGGRVVVNTTLGALGGGFANWLLMLLFNNGKAFAEGFALGVLAGLVGITAGCYWFGNGDNYLIGTIAACLGEALRRCLAANWIDDVVSAIPVHGLPGFFGTIAIPLWSQTWSCNPGGPVGLFYAKDSDEMDAAWELLGVQLWGCIVIMAWAGASTILTVFCINQIPSFELRLPRATELKGLDQVEHDMHHTSEEFVEITKHFFATLSKHSNEDGETKLKNAAIEALQCLSFAHRMQEFDHERVNRKCDFQLTVKDITIHNLQNTEVVNGCAASYTGGKMTLLLEVVSAVRLEDCFQRDFNFFAPRYVTAIKDVGVGKDKRIVFGGEFTFLDFYVPPGTEESTYVCFTLITGGTVFGQAHLSFMRAGWRPIDGSSANGIQATPSGDVIFLKDSVARANPEPVTVEAAFLCPVHKEGRRGSQMTRIVRADKKFRGSLHHSGSLNAAEIEARLDAAGRQEKPFTMDKLVHEQMQMHDRPPPNTDLKMMADAAKQCKSLKEEMESYLAILETPKLADNTEIGPHKKVKPPNHVKYMSGAKA